MDSLGSLHGTQIPNNHLRNDTQSERTSWDYHTITVTRVSGYGFGIAVSGGRDNPHFANGDPSIAVSDVLQGGPAEDRLQVNDRIISVNGVSLENVEYATAVQVLRDSGNTVSLVIKRRVSVQPVLNVMTSPNHSHQLSHSLSSTNLGATGGSQQSIKLVVTKSNKKDDFGIVLGCKIFIKEISTKVKEQLATNGYSLQEGDIVNRIHNTNCTDSMSLKEAKKIIDSCKERLNLVVLRDVISPNNSAIQSSSYMHATQVSNCSNVDETFLPGHPSYSAQNLYVQPPSRSAISTLLDDKSNLTPRGRSRNPLSDVSLSQLDIPSAPQTSSHSRSKSGLDEPPRPPPPRGDDFYSSRRQLYEDDSTVRSKQNTELRFISFQKEGSVGIRLTGGNEAGIFVTAVQSGSPASLQGLTPGDKILKVNDMDMTGVTREEAVLFLLSLQDRIDLIVQYSKEDYDSVVSNQRGDSFHIKTHFHYENPSKGEMSFRAGDVFRVIDTLYNGIVGSWQVLRIGRGHQEMQRGVIPNKSRAEELATAQFNATKKEINASESRSGFFKRRRTTHRRSKSLSRENWDDVVFSDSISKFPAYERVVLRHPGFVRPVIFFGPVADVARERLIKDFADKFTAPLQDDNKNTSGIVRLSNIRDIMDRGKHALLDITPNAVDRLNYAQFYPIVIMLKADTKHIIKQLRQGIPKSAHKSSKKLFEQCQKLERVWSHVFSSIIVLNDADIWYRKLKESIDLQQSGAVWMSETKPVESLSDDFLFPMTTSRLSYASSPESDLELSPGPSASLSLGNLPQLVKSCSDPSIATNQDNLDRDRELNIGDGMPPPYTNQYEQHHPGRSAIDNKYGFASNDTVQSEIVPNFNPNQRLQTNGTAQDIYGTGPDLPPRIDRASKPPPLTPPQSSNSSSLKHSDIARSAHDRLFGSKTLDSSDIQDDYISRNSFEKRANSNSLEREQVAENKNNGSYDSVSSYDSYNTTQLSLQNNKLGPNAPDDLKKSVPVSNGRQPITPNKTQEYRNPSANDQLISPRNSSHLNSDSNVNRNLQYEHSRSMLGVANDLNRQASPGRPNFPADRNIGQNTAEQMAIRNSKGAGIVNIPQRPTNLGNDRKSTFETKTDYGKYSRNNSATQADYKIVKTAQTGPTNGAPFKPVPPPKPKNYRPPVQTSNNGPVSPQWENGELMSSRSPNGFFYPPPSTSHYHHQNTPNSPTSGQHIYNQNQYGSNHYNQQPPYPGRESREAGGNGYNGAHQYNSQYIHRVPGMGNVPHHLTDRHGLDLAGSREQRGSAFELYRKPQINSASHHHNIRQMDSLHYDARSPSPPPPTKPKKKLLKSPFSVIKSAFLKTTRPLRRQNSLLENSHKKETSSLRRQRSMHEHRHYSDAPYVSPEEQHYQQLLRNNNQQYDYRHEPFNPNFDKSTYQNLENDSIYGYNDRNYYQEEENLYANRALIELEKRNAMQNNEMGGSRLIRRHSMADRARITPDRVKANSNQKTSYYNNNETCEPIYQTKGGAYMMKDDMADRRNYEEEILQNRNFQNRRERHRDHIYQSRNEMQERICQSRKVVDRPPLDLPTKPEYSARDAIYQSRRELKENGFKTRTELRDHIYQSRCEAMSMAEPIYSAKTNAKCEPIYESKSENHEALRTNDDSVLSEILNFDAKHSLSKNQQNGDGQDSDEDDEDTLTSSKSVSKVTETIENPIFSKLSDTIPMSPKSSRPPHHISNVIKRTAAPNISNALNQYSSRTSVETQFTSQASLPVGPPNAQSTPYCSEMSIGLNGFFPPPREPSTTRGYFDEEGGTLLDEVWNVSLEIPKNALAGAKQEIYFTVSDPRVSSHVGGPPLDMENGETMLSPLVMCGPTGLNFLVPVTLNIPHCAFRTPSLGLALKATDSEKNLQKVSWDNIELPSNAAAHTVSVKVDHF